MIITLFLSTITVLCLKSIKLFANILHQTITPVISYFKADKSHENMPDLTQIFPFWTGEIVLIILVASASAVYFLINRNTIITFMDIRDVNNIVNILLIQMDYEYLGKKEGTMKFYYDGLEEGREKLNSFIKNNYLLKKINVLALKSDGNTISINAQN